MQGIDKRTLYVGGLAEDVTEDILRAAFIPFGEVTDVQLPINPNTSTHKGFGFVTFETVDDAADAVDNMHLSEIYGRVLKVNYSRPYNPIDTGRKKAIWEEDEYQKEHISNRGLEKESVLNTKVEQPM